MKTSNKQKRRLIFHWQQWSLKKDPVKLKCEMFHLVWHFLSFSSQQEKHSICYFTVINCLFDIELRNYCQKPFINFLVKLQTRLLIGELDTRDSLLMAAAKQQHYLNVKKGDLHLDLLMTNI